MVSMKKRIYTPKKENINKLKTFLNKIKKDGK